MTQQSTHPRPLPWGLALSVVLACVAWFLYQRNAGLYPAIFGDEWYYSKLARLVPLSEAVLPSYLYLWMFGASTACGDGFLECVRVGNLGFFLAAAPFVYLITRRFASAPLAFIVALASVLAPLNIYTAYFMPESTYYFGFWLLSWVALARSAWPALLHGLVLGAILGAMSLVKVHALFLLPALCLYLVYAGWQRADGGARAGLLRGAAAALLAAVCTVGIKFGLGWLLAGEAGLSLLGPFYQGTVNSGSGISRLALLNPAFINGRGHLAALAVVYGVPLALLAWALCTGVLRRQGTTAGSHKLLHVYTLLMLGAGAGMTIAFTTTQMALGENEILRLHLRYYSFVFPLLVMVAAAGVEQVAAGMQAAQERRPALRWTIALALCAVLAFALLRLPTYSLSMTDGPDIASIRLDAWHGRVVLALQCALLLAWAARVRGAVQGYLYVALPVTLALGLTSTSMVLARHEQPTLGDQAGALVRSQVAPSERNAVAVAGTDMAAIMRVQFHLDDKDSTGILLESTAPLQDYQVPPDKKWLLLLGDIALPEQLKPLVRTPEYSLVRLPAQQAAIATLQLSGAPDPQVVTQFEGMSAAEPWGRWSDAKLVRIHFAQPLPRRVGFILSAKAYEINTTLPFTVRVGGQSKQLRLGWAEQSVGLNFETDGTARTLEIEVPQPTAPNEPGQPGAQRQIGIGISKIVVTDGERQGTAAP